jgi:predicted small integral membrane protein
VTFRAKVLHWGDETARHLPRWIVMITAIHLALAGFPLIRWLGFHREDWIAWFFDYQSPLFFVAINALALVLSIAAWKQFSPRQSLRGAWLLISFSAGFRLLGSVLNQIVGHHSWGDPLVPSLQRQAGWTAEGPISMLLLASGLFIMLRLYKRLGLLARLTAFDHAMLGVVSAYSLYVGYSVIQIQIRTHPPITLDAVLHWAGDPLLCLLLFEAIFIRRAVTDMGWGLIAKCWGAFVAAILLTSIGSMGQWAVSFQYIRWPASALTWFIWYPVAAAYALGAAYQVEAIRTVQARLRHQEVPHTDQSLETTIPFKSA